MDDITIGVTENVNLISVTAQPNDQIIDIAVTETVETVLLDVSTTVQEVSVTATQNVIVENITVDYVSNENYIDINVTDATQDVTLNVTPTLIEINILRSGGEVNILQFDSLADFPTTGSSDYFYLAKDTNKLYRWTGSAYAEISASANPVWGQIIGTLSEQTDLQNALNLKAPINSPTFTGTVSGITKGMVGLGAVDNTSDLDKPISTATQTALNAKQPLDADLTSIAALSGTFGLLKKTANNSYTIDTNTYLTEITSSDVTDALGFTPENAANKGIANGYASLDGGGKVPSSQLPSYVDDVIEVANYGSLPSTGETGKIYITLDTNKIYRWTGSVYVEVSSSAAVWGGITGTLSNQTDLQNALDAKQDDLNGTGFVKASGTTITYDNTVYYPDSNPDGYTSNVGTVTSVAMTVPAAFSVSGSPITSSGILAVTATGNTTQYIAGDGSLVTFPTMSTAGTLIREVRNTTGATLTKGTVVYISGATGNKPTVSKAIATGDSTSAQTFGLVQADIANNANGNVVCAGDITGIDTSALTEGAQLYLSSTTAGAYTTTKQYAPAHLVYIGIVTRAHPSLGQIEVNIQNGYELDELHNVAAQTPSNNDGLFYETSTSLWKNKSIATVLGYTPANGADYMSLSGDQTIGGLKTFSDFALFDHNIFIKQGTDTSFLSGYNVIDATSSSIFLGLPNTFGANLVLSGLTTQRNFTFPDAAGTIALTSDIPSSAGFVATTGDQSIGGDKTFTGDVINDGDLYIKQDASFSPKTGYVNLFAGATGNILSYHFGNNNVIQNLSFPSTGRSYDFPNASGTIALTSDLSSYVHTSRTLTINGTTYDLSADRTWTISTTDSSKLPLTGGTLTGALNGTIISLSGSSSANALVVNQNSSYHAVQVNQSGTGAGIGIANSGNTDGLLITHTGGRGIRINSANAGFGIIINNDTASTSVPFVIQKSGATKISLTDAGAGEFASTITATQFIKSGGTSAQFLKADGSIDSSTYLTTGSASSSYLPLSGGTLTGALSGTSATFSSTVTATGFEVGNGQFYRARRTSSNLLTDMIGIPSGTNDVRVLTTGAFNVVSGSLTTMLTVTDAGRVGIGTTAPGVRFVNAGATLASVPTLGSGSIGANAILSANGLYGLYTGVSSEGWVWQQVQRNDGGTAVYPLILQPSGGNVGIGTTSAVAYSGYNTLTIAGNTLGGVLAVRNGIYGINLSGRDNLAVIDAVDNSASLVLTTNSTERMRITSGGNVGIGTTSPTDYSGYNTLHINGKSGTGSGVVRVTNANGTAGFNMYADNAATFNTTNAIDIVFRTQDTERMRINSSGTVCVRRTTSLGSAYSMAIQENIAMYVNANGNNIVNFFNASETYVSSIVINASSVAYNTSSDYRLKTDLKAFSGLDIVSKINVYDFAWKYDNSRTHGVIAHELQEVLPNAVSGIKDAIDENGNIKNQGVDYSKIVPVLIQSIKELKSKIETLENK